MNESLLDVRTKRNSVNTSMSTQSKTMPMLELKVYVRIVAAVFSISSATAFVMALLRILNPNLYYLEPLDGGDIALHYFVSSLMVVSSAVGFLNSCVVLHRGAGGLSGGGGAGVGSGGAGGARGVTTWLLLDSLFETSRVVYVFMCEVVIKGRGPLQLYELLVSIAQYLLDSFLYCQMILRH